MHVEDFDRITRAGVRPAAATVAKAPVILLSRALYRSRVFNLRGIAGSDRPGALQLQLAAWEPFDVPAYRVGMRGDYALAFAWDEAWVGQALAESGWDASRAIEPECLYRAPLPNGMGVVQCLDGYEAQAWDGGLLMDGRWWADAPPEAELRAFLDGRGGAGSIGEALPPLVDPEWRKRPWLRVMQPVEIGQASLGGVRHVFLGAACLLALWVGVEARAWMDAAERLAALRAEEAVLQERLKPLQADRAEAEMIAARANSLAGVLSGHPPLEVLEQLLAGLPAQGIQLQELTLDERRLRLELTLAPDLPRATVVRQLQASGFFSDVTEARGSTPTSVIFEMSLPYPVADFALPASGPVGRVSTPSRIAQ